MKKTMIFLSALLLMLSLVAVVGCGSGDTAEETKAEAPKAEEAAPTTVALHDCDGGCGMTQMAAAQTTEIDGKFYCAGCAKKVQEAAHEEGHEGHSH
jgi:hypothetical protein